jgi:beta-galactosidase
MSTKNKKMKSLLFNLLTLSILIASCTSSNKKVIGDFDFNDNWKFHRGDTPEAQHFDFNDEEWEKVSLPHDWSIGGGVFER